MAKKLAINDNLRALLTKFSEGTEETSVTFYEAVILNTLPISKKGTIFDKSIIAQSYLQEMADYVEAGNGIPIHTIHQQYAELPFGKVVKAQLFFDSNQLPELRVIFYMDNQHVNLIQGIESGAISELSIGAQPKHMLCSECGFDYLGASATFSNFWDMECDKEHKIGENGVHLNITGLDRWYELSLVSAGAAKNTKIIPAARSLLGDQEYNRLRASGVTPELTLLQATMTAPKPETTPPKDNSMDLAALNQKYIDASVTLGLKEKEIVTLTTSNTELTQKLSATTTELATAKTEAETAKAALTKAQADFAAVDAGKEKTRADSATKVLFSLASKFAVAAGIEAPKEDADALALEKVIDDSRAKLSTLPTGGVAQAIGTGKGATQGAGYAAAHFNTRP